MKEKIEMVGFSDSQTQSSQLSLEAYASDASIYRILPQSIFCPDSEESALAVIRDAMSRNIPVTPRGGGTGLAGGALGKGYIIDCSRLTEIKHISIGNRQVVCQPGIIYNDLNLALKKHGLIFPPDPSSGDSCQIGGMLANNSSGPRSVKYGLTSDYVDELTVVGKDGKPLTMKKYGRDSSELQRFFGDHPEYGEVLRILQDHRAIILERWPTPRKNSAGYNLHQVIRELDQGLFNLPALYVGSEGTLGLFLSVQLRLLPIPTGTRSFRLFFDSLENAGIAVAPLLETGPSSLEIVDGSTLNLIGREKYGIPLHAQAMLMLEYDADLDQSEDELNRVLGRLKLCAPIERAASEEERQALWAARKAIVPTLYRHHTIKRPIPFIEDASLPVERLTEYISWVKQRLEKENLTFGLFGHVGDGNVHIRPLLDLSQTSDLELAQCLYEDVYGKILELGGSSTAEHADGRLRAPILRRLYGDAIYELFIRIKAILDPRALFNPDVMLSERRLTDDIDLAKLELTCAACGKCNGYCPAFEIFRREDASPRGWLRMHKFAGRDNPQLGQYYQFCLNCKNCSTVCPAGVDIAGEILKYKGQYPNRNAGRAISLFDKPKLFGSLIKLGSAFYPLSATAFGRKTAALLGRRPFGFDQDAVFPRPARQTLRERYPDLCRITEGVALFHGCADNYFDSVTGDALVRVFAHNHWKLAFPAQTCCGLPMEVHGHRDNMIEKAKFNITSLEPFDTVVFTCASCLHRVADYHHLFDVRTEYHRRALTLRDRLYDVSQYLRMQKITIPALGPDAGITLSYHHPCHLRAVGLEKEPLKLLEGTDGIRIVHPERADRCCGQAGSFGYIHYREGKAIFAAKREEYLRLAPDVIISSCPSCIAKIKKEMGTDIRVCHPIELVADLCEGNRLDGKRA